MDENATQTMWRKLVTDEVKFSNRNPARENIYNTQKKKECIRNRKSTDSF